MKFLLDSCVSKFAVNELQAAGMDVKWIPEIGPDPGDEAILEMALKEDRVLVTIDKDFGDLEKTIDSVVSQAVTPREWIIVDDGSTDRTGQVADQAAKAHPWIKAIHKANRGFSVLPTIFCPRCK